MNWVSDHQQLLVWAGIISLAVFILSLLLLPWLVAQIPEDYFLPKKRQPTAWKDQHPIIRLLALAGKNLIGCSLIVAGLLMLFLPGQGILTLVMGLLLVDYPGKFRLERKVVKTPAILNGLNWLRRKAKKPPLIL
ncbi:MAG: PGPGW domain-containing protein [Porticoccaceae bacterium]|nr:PGPGW domain-containing protein [Porticoccaceae bacterium]